MGFQVPLFILQVLIIQHAFTYPTRDYILAYIPIEEYIYLSPTIEYLPISTCYLAYPETPSVSYYSGPSSYRVSAPLTTSGGFSVTCTSTPVPPCQSGLETVTVISPSTPEVILPSVPIELATPTVPTNQYEVYEGTDAGEFIDDTVEPVLLPEPIPTTVVTATSPTVVNAYPPTAGAVTFSGPLPAYGSIKIYASCC